VSTLSKHWREWRKRRKEELLALNFSPTSARLWSGREARCRQSTENLVGRKAALSSDLMIDFRLGDGGYSLSAIVPECEVPSEYIDRARAWASEPDSPLPH
jgi:hypothetical protein